MVSIYTRFWRFGRLGWGHWSKSWWLARIFGRAIPAPYGNYSKGSGDCRVDFFDGIPARRDPEGSGLRCAQLGGGFLSPFQGFLFLGMTRYPGWRFAYPGLLSSVPSGLMWSRFAGLLFTGCRIKSGMTGRRSVIINCNGQGCRTSLRDASHRFGRDDIGALVRDDP